MSGSIVNDKYCRGSYYGFVNAITIWINNPQVINKKSCGSVVNYFRIIGKNKLSYNWINKTVNILGLRICDGVTEEMFTKEFKLSETLEISEISEIGSDSVENTESFLKENALDISDDEIAIVIRNILNKKHEMEKSIFELVIFDKADKSCSFITLVPVKCFTEQSGGVVYKFSYNDGPDKKNISLYTCYTESYVDLTKNLSIKWIENILLYEMVKLCEKFDRSELTELCNTVKNTESIQSKPYSEYSILYNELKKKYSIYIKNCIKKNGSHSIVFRDISIAAYLIIMWKNETKNKQETQKFINIGCGNGLLVYILVSEGYDGYGVNDKKKDIWNIYGQNIILKEMTIQSSDELLLRDCDWIICNNSNVMIPWILVMASRSSYRCKIFLLPYYFWDFDGKYIFNKKHGNIKIEEKKTTVNINNDIRKGKYEIYLDYIETLGKICGFIMEKDKLRIPYGKSICFIGRSRNYEILNEHEMVEKREYFLSKRCNTLQENIFSTDMSDGGYIDYDITKTKNIIMQTIFNTLLQCENKEIKQIDEGRTWNRGGILKIKDVPSMLDDSILLKNLKKKCGGIKTLLKNYYNVFVVKKGMIQLRDFTLDDPFYGYRKRKCVINSDRYKYNKTILCWYHEYHPDGCPRKSEYCIYAHGVTELKPKPQK